MAPPLRGRIKLNKILLLLSLIGSIGLFAVLGTVLVLIGQKYQKSISVESGTPRQFEIKRTFYIKKITVQKDGQVYEFGANGEAFAFEGASGTRIKHRKIFSNQQIEALFGSLSGEELNALGSHYFGGGANLTIIIESSEGIKTIIIDDQGEEPPPGPLDDIVDDIDDLIDEIDDPPPSPPPSTPPTPTPSFTPTPTSTPSSSPTPTPSPGSTPIPKDPFSCNMLQNQINNVTVSNTVCEKTQ